MDRLGPVIATTANPLASGQIRSARLAAAAGADRVEVRIDAISRGETCEALFDLAREMPLLVSGCRNAVLPREAALLRAAQERGALVDVPFSEDLPADLWGLNRARMVLSFHDFEGMPDDPADILGRMRAVRAAWYKLVPTAADFPDVVGIKKFLESESGGGDVCAFAMGVPGIASRAMALAWGSAATYCSAPESPAAAPGQMGLAELVAIYRAASIRPGEPLYGVIGWPLKETGSPGLHNRWLGELRLPGRFLQLPVKDPDAFFRLARQLPLLGAAVTIPHKREVVRRLASSSRLVRLVGACNTMLWRGGGWAGANTDAFGIRHALRGLTRPCRTLVLGAGGAAAAVCAVAARMGPAAVAARKPEAAEALAGRFRMEVVSWAGRRLAPWDLLVNTTPVGQEGDLSPYPYPLGGSAVFDLIVRDGGTGLIRAALDEGLRAIPGRVMLEAQARLQFRLFTGCGAPAGRAASGMAGPAGRHP
jgi:shikimate dehydrogenase